LSTPKQVKIPNRLRALENLNEDMDINRAWETIKESIKISAQASLGYYELKQHMPCFNKRCSDYQIKENKPNYNDYSIQAK
jgi:hypothetical protein